MKGKLLSRASILAFASLLAACSAGGGGVNTTPPPPGPTPTSTPTPTPSANKDLLGPLVSESFANDTAIGKATFGSSGTSGSVSNTSITLRYNAGNQSYSLSSTSGSITFVPSDIDNAQSNAGAVVYVHSNGSTTDSLTLTRPGTSGPVTYTYVGSAFWQHTQLGSSSGSGFINAAAYGVVTPDAALPRSGGGDYAIDLIGAETVADNLLPLSGQGNASVDFATGNVIITGTLDALLVGHDEGFSSTAKIGSTNQFSGNFRFDDFGTFNGTLNGRFYGPAANEIGAAFSATQSDGRIAVGTIMGRQGSAGPGNTSFADSGRPLVNSQSFSAMAVRDNYNLTGFSGRNDTLGTFSNTSTRAEAVQIRYDAATDTYTLVAPDKSVTLKLGQTYYDGPTGEQTFVLGSPTPWTTMPLSYVRLGIWLGYQGAGSGTDYRDSYIAFGMPTAAGDIVRTGSAGFKIGVAGRTTDSDYPNVTLVYGTGDLWVDFAAGAVRGIVPVDLVENYYISGRPYAQTRGDLTLTGALGSGNGFSGTAKLNGIGDYNGSMQGQFFGPGAVEVGGIFNATDGAGGVLVGGFAGGRDASVTDPAAVVPKLTDLTTPTALDFLTSNILTGYSGELLGITFDPATQSYKLTFERTRADLPTDRSVTLNSADETSGDADYRAFLTTLDPGTEISAPFAARVLRSDNTKVALNYTSMAEFVVQRTYHAGEFDWSRYFTVFGIGTTRMPSTGTANYAGIVRGVANVSVTGGTSFIYSLDGKSSLSVDFASQTFNATLSDLVGTPVAVGDGSPLSANPQRVFDALTFNGDITGANFRTSGDASRIFNGRFFGPNAAEFGASFFYRNGSAGVDPEAVEMRGVAAGVRK